MDLLLLCFVHRLYLIQSCRLHMYRYCTIIQHQQSSSSENIGSNENLERQRNTFSDFFQNFSLVRSFINEIINQYEII